MSNFNSLMQRVDTICLKAFEEDAIWTPQADEAEPIAITGITSPAPEQDVLYGGDQGVTNVYFFVRLPDGSIPQTGDTISYGGVVYAVLESNVDRTGGTMLKLRKTTPIPDEEGFDEGFDGGGFQ